MSFKAGIVAGSIATVACNPLDIVRVNIQSGGHTNKSAILYIYKKEGIKGFYRGVFTGLLTIPTFWSIYFPTYEYLKSNTSTPIAAYMSSNISSTITSPLWYIRQKKQTFQHFNILSEIKSLKLSQFYSGLSSTYLINSNFVFQLPLYEYFKSKVDNTTFNIFLASSTAKTLATIITFPLDNIRVLCRKNPHYTLTETVKLLHAKKSYYWGINNYLVKSIPYHSIIFCTYEYFKK